MKPVEAKELYYMYAVWGANQLIKELEEEGFIIIRKQDYERYLEDIEKREDDLK